MPDELAAGRSRGGAPYLVARVGAVVDAATGDEVGHVHRTDYGWAATSSSGARPPMHATRQDACDALWMLRRTGSAVQG